MSCSTLRRIRNACLLVVLALAGGCAQPRPTSTSRPLPAPLRRPQRIQPLVRTVPTPPPRVDRRRSRLPAEVIPACGFTRRWDYIVIHHSATTSGGAARFHRMHTRERGWDEMGYHFVIGNGTDTADGQIEVGSRWGKQKHGAHCKTPDNRYNDHGIGICLVGDFENGGRPSRAQMESLEHLLTHLMARYRVPPGRVTSHGAVTRRTACPGRNFPMAMLKTRLYAPRACDPDAPEALAGIAMGPKASLGTKRGTAESSLQELLNQGSDSVDELHKVDVSP